MRKTIWIIFKKECHRFFKDRRTVFATIFMPALLLYAMYSILGSGTTQLTTVPEDYSPQCYVQNRPTVFGSIFDTLSFQVTDTTDPEAAKESVARQEADLLIIFPADFDNRVLHFSQEAAAPDIQVFYHSGSTRSLAAYDLFKETANQLEESVCNVLDVNREVENPDLATVSPLVSSLLPMFIVLILFTGCSNIGPESIAGEKERGTIATLLVTPVSRTAIAIGKISSLCLFALLAGLSSFIGIMLSLPKMFGSDFNLDIYGIATYGYLLCVIATTVLLVVAITAVISANAKSVKEATTATAMLTLLSSLAGVVPMLSANFSGMGWRFVPLLNCVLCISDIFRLEISVASILLTCLSNLVYAALLAALLSKMFNSERVMFKR